MRGFAPGQTPTISRSQLAATSRGLRKSFDEMEITRTFAESVGIPAPYGAWPGVFRAKLWRAGYQWRPRLRCWEKAVKTYAQRSKMVQVVNMPGCRCEWGVNEKDALDICGKTPEYIVRIDGYKVYLCSECYAAAGL